MKQLVPVNLKNTPEFDEKWVQQIIAGNPAILGLGDLVLKDYERRQPNAGRLDLLLQDPETLKRYEIELQLGPTDESHIIRTIEYWDIERKRYPQYEHTAVIIAEEITSRFLNVVQLLNGTIPLIALKLDFYKIDDDYAITFTKVLDEVRYGLVDEDEPLYQPVNRSYWESERGTKETFSITEKLLSIVREIEPRAKMKFNKQYIGLDLDGSPATYITFTPRKAHVILSVRIPKDAQTDEMLENESIVQLTYDAGFKQYNLKIERELNPSQRELLLALIEQAKERYGRG